MRITSLVSGLGVLVFAATVAGCGGGVTTGGTGGDGGNGGAGGGEGGSATTDTNTTDTNTTGTNTTPIPVDPQSYCSSACDQLLGQGCVMGPKSACVQNCVNLFTNFPMCVDQTAALLDCVLGKLPAQGCAATEACEQQEDILTTCTGGEPTCGESVCSGNGDPGVCSCESECNNQVLQVDCASSAGGVECQCVIDGELAGTCKNADLSCSSLACCAEFFFPDDN